MPISPAREAAYHILRRVESGRGFAVDWLQSAELAKLKDADRALATELVMGVLRWRGELDFQIERRSGKPLKYFDREVATILRLGIYQIRFLEKVPKPAVVNEAVELVKAARKRSAAGLVNAVLRKCEPPRRPLAAEAQKPEQESAEAACRSIPAWLLERWVRHFGEEGARALAWRSVSRPRTALRVCTPEQSREEIQQELAGDGINTLRGRYSSRALWLESGNLQSSKLLRQGRVMIQDEASQLVAELVAPKPGQRVLDLCAAPGIKASQLAAELQRGTLVACDLSARRLGLMRRLVAGRVPASVKLHLVRLDATRTLPFAMEFDRILLDVPCSGTGTLARNPEVKLRLRPEDLSRLAEMQAKIFRNALAVLALGGRAVYATCSLEPEENEQVVEKVLQETGGFRLLSAKGLSQELPTLSSLFDACGYFRTRPDVHHIDGFFAAGIERCRGNS